MDRLFIGVYPEGIVYADRYVQPHGDYKRLAFLSYRSLALTFSDEQCLPELRKKIVTHAATLQEKRGG